MAEVTCVYPAGKYYVGDVCYALSSTVYELQWGDKHSYKAGTFDVEYKGKVGKISVNHTMYGDGIYVDTRKGLEFSVDAGVIGIVPFELCNLKNITKEGTIKGGHFIESTTPVEFRSQNGIFVITYNALKGAIIIDTEDIEDDEDSEDSEDNSSDA